MDRQFVKDRFLKQNSGISLLSFSRWIVAMVILGFLAWKTYLILFIPTLIDYLTPVFIGLTIGSLTYHIFFVATRQIYQTDKGDNPNQPIISKFDCNNCGLHLNHIVPETCPQCDNEVDQVEVQQMINAYYLTEEDIVKFAFVQVAGLLVSTILGVIIWDVRVLAQSSLIINIPMMVLFVGLGLFFMLDLPNYYPNNPYKKSVQ